MSFGNWLAKQLEDPQIAEEYAAAQQELQYELSFAYAHGPVCAATAETYGTPIHGRHEFEIRVSGSNRVLA